MTWMHGKADQTMLLKPSENDTVPLPQVTRLCMRNDSYHPDSRESRRKQLKTLGILGCGGFGFVEFWPQRTTQKRVNKAPSSSPRTRNLRNPDDGVGCRVSG